MRRKATAAGAIRATHGPDGNRKGARPAPARGRRVAQTLTPEVTEKLQKVLAQAGLGSRRDMEQIISNGQVSVNGAVAIIGARVGPADLIKVAGRVIRVRQKSRLPRVLLYHKPEGEITSRDDPRGRPSVFEHLPAVAGAKWISIGRLDFNTCGLLMFTTSGDLVNRMTHPRFEVEREYAVRVMGQIQPHHLLQMTNGVELDDGIARCVAAELRGGEGSNQWCHVVMKEGRNRVVRRLFEKLGLHISRLMRVRFGIIELPPRIKRGQTYELGADETQRLLDWLDGAPPPQTPSRR